MRIFGFVDQVLIEVQRGTGDCCWLTEGELLQSVRHDGLESGSRSHHLPTHFSLLSWPRYEAFPRDFTVLVKVDSRESRVKLGDQMEGRDFSAS
jgi:hypothetical protein